MQSLLLFPFTWTKVRNLFDTIPSPILTVLAKSSKVFSCFAEFPFTHSFADIPVHKCSLGVEYVESVGHSFERCHTTDTVGECRQCERIYRHISTRFVVPEWSSTHRERDRTKVYRHNVPFGGLQHVCCCMAFRDGYVSSEHERRAHQSVL